MLKASLTRALAAQAEAPCSNGCREEASHELLELDADACESIKTPAVRLMTDMWTSDVRLNSRLTGGEGKPNGAIKSSNCWTNIIQDENCRNSWIKAVTQP